MKVWTGYGTEHSANLVIVGKFKNIKDAQEAKDIIDGLSTIISEGIREGILSEHDGLENGEFSDEQMDFFRQFNLMDYSYADMSSFLYEFNSTLEGSKLIITTEDLVTNGLINTLISKSAKIEIYSAHHYKDTGYGR